MPWLGYFERIARSDIHVVLDHVQFEKNSFTNRNKIRTKDGLLWLTIPLATKGRFGNLEIHDLEFASGSKWKEKHWSSLKMGYSRSTCFHEFNVPYEQIYSDAWIGFMPFIRSLLSQHLLDLGISTPLIFSSEISANGFKSDLILDICESLGAKTYLSGSQGRAYLNDEAFFNAGISVEYQDYKHPVYAQAGPDFQSHLGIFDLLFNHGKNSLKIIMTDHEHRVARK
jgi:hypothetical protein